MPPWHVIDESTTTISSDAYDRDVHSMCAMNKVSMYFISEKFFNEPAERCVAGFRESIEKGESNDGEEKIEKK